ncbi:DUF1491 family protein [Pelagibacterium montanilacus]|uniref:DUF1491 family protein n=1 Tax=Pelagibacterium montanilacus TaxID=2185280 RepID=UPI000F8DD8D4|nr:DUF1491 family protein [Pelagibacterium montanilacus]
MQRLRSDIWCSAFVRRHNALGSMCVVARRGDPVAGQVWIEIDHLNGTVSLLVPAPDIGMGEARDDRTFIVRHDRVDPPTVRERIAREVDFDPDVWVLALESRSGEHGVPVIDQPA